MPKLQSNIILLTSTFYLLGIDKGIMLGAKMKLCHKVISVCTAITLVTLIMKDNVHKTFVIILWNALYSLQYFIIVIYNVFFEEIRITDLFKKFKNVDRHLYIPDERTTIGFLISALTAVVVAHRLLLTAVLICGRDQNASSIPIVLGSQICINIIDLEGVWRIFLVLTIKYRLQYIWRELKETFPKEWWEEPVVSVLLPEMKNLGKEKDTEILNLVESYQALVDTADDISKNFQLTFTAHICCNTIKLFILIYRFMSDSSNVGDLTSVLFSFILGITVDFILNFIPCVIAEICDSKTKEIKSILVRQTLRTAMKEKEKAAIKRFISLINVRPISFYLLGVYKIDASLIAATVDVCVTYTIFLLQYMITQ